MYESKTEPMAHQKAILDVSKDSIDHALFCEQGTGKTKMVIDTAGHLYREGKVKTVVVIAPNSVYRQWAKEIKTHLGLPPNEVTVITWGKWKKPRIDWLVRALGQDTGLMFFLVNVEAFSKTLNDASYMIHQLLEARGRGDTMLVVDESTTVKTPGAKRTRNVKRISEFFRYARILTGTPLTNHPGDLYSQYGMLDTSYLGSSYERFKTVYCKTEPGYKGIQKVTGFKNLDLLMDTLAPITSQVRLKDCVDMPDQVFIQRDISLTKSQAELYNKLLEDDTLFNELEVCGTCQGTARAPDPLSPDPEGMTDCTICYKGYLTEFIEFVLVKLLRLQQITSGFIPGGEGIPPVRIKGDNPKADAVLEIIEEDPTQPTLIWCVGRPEARLLHEKIKGSLLYTGDVSPNQREKNKDAFVSGKNNVMIMTLATGSRGLNLQRATRSILFSLNWSYEQLSQAIARNYRIGQESKVTYYDLVAPGTIDEMIHERVEKKEELARRLIDKRLQPYQREKERYDS